MAELLPIAEAAALLGQKPGTVRRWCRSGMPHAPGRKGRGCQTLVSVEDARAWRGAPIGEQQLLALANDVPGLLACAMHERWRECEELDKRRLAGIVAALWYASATTVLDRMRQDNCAVPDVRSLPPEIQYLQKIAQND